MKWILSAFVPALFLAVTACSGGAAEGEACTEDGDCADDLTCDIMDGADEGVCAAADMATGDTAS